MEQGFVDVLKKLADEQGKDIFLNANKFKGLLSDYTKNEYKKESRLVVQVYTAEVANAILNADDLVACKKAQIVLLHEEHFLSNDVAADLVDVFAFVIRGDTSKSVYPMAKVEVPEQKTAPKQTYTPPPEQTYTPPPEQTYTPPPKQYSPRYRSSTKNRYIKVFGILLAIVIGAAVLSSVVPNLNLDSVINPAKNAIAEVTPAIPAIPAIPAAPAKPSTVTVANSLNIRSAPTANGKVVKTLKKGDAVIITGNAYKGWTPVKHGSSEGWVSSDLLTAPATASAAAPAKSIAAAPAKPASTVGDIVEWARGKYSGDLVLTANAITNGSYVNITGVRTVKQSPLSGHPNLKWAYIYVGNKKYGVVWDRTTYTNSSFSGIELGMGGSARSAFDFYSGSDKNSIFADIAREAPSIKEVK
jgi:uncharacterized protein YgiM (DUF1202 family)